MGVLRNIKIKEMTKEKANGAVQEISNLINTSKNIDEETMTEKETLQLLIYKFCNKYNITPMVGPNDNALQLFTYYVLELVNMEMSIIGDEQKVQLVINTLAKDWLKEIGWV